MPTWGMHLYAAKKLKEKLKIRNYNNFLIGNIVTDINNGKVVENISKIIEHKQTHYYTENKNKMGKSIYYDMERFIRENRECLKYDVCLGYIVHLLTDEYWNNLTYDKYGIYNENNQLIGVKLNNGTILEANSEQRRKIKQNDFKIFADYIYRNNLVDIPIYDEEIYEQIKRIKQIDLTKEDIKKVTDYFEKVKNGVYLEIKDYKIYTLDEMEKNMDMCVNYIISYLKQHDMNL